MSAFELTADACFLTHVAGTYDTYKCNDCKIVLSGYRRGDPGLHEHIQKGGGMCRYITAKYRGRQGELIILRGKLRFQNGSMAFPEYMFDSCNGYIPIQGIKYCIVCASQYNAEHRYDVACKDMIARLNAKTKGMKFDVPLDKIPLFAQGYTCGPQLDDGLETDGVQAHSANDFSVLGEPANMYHLPGTADTHKCLVCGIMVKHFVENDSLLGEHIYHRYNTGGVCGYIENKFRGQRGMLMLILGKERWRKGAIAFPDDVTKADFGRTEIDKLYRCVICSATINWAFTQGTRDHRPHCADMKRMFIMKLKDMKLFL